jgi:Zn finger protein HypA/HybF involved in hydrogenase expression
MSGSVMTPVLFHVVLWSLLAIIAALTYIYAVSTRRQTTCRSCGERVRTEHDSIQSCPSCGAPLP